MAAAGFRGAAVLGLLCLSSACASAPTPLADLSGTAWHVVAVNGRATPAQGDYSIHFDRSGGVGARFGCNSMGGQYSMTGGTLTMRNLAQTLMGCPEPAGTFEREGGAVLGQPMQVAFTSNERMSLSNAAGSISLDPLP
jgi:heat shock protein HslJ